MWIQIIWVLINNNIKNMLHIKKKTNFVYIIYVKSTTAKYFNTKVFNFITDKNPNK